MAELKLPPPVAWRYFDRMAGEDDVRIGADPVPIVGATPLYDGAAMLRAVAEWLDAKAAHALSMQSGPADDLSNVMLHSAAMHISSANGLLAAAGKITKETP